MRYREFILEQRAAAGEMHGSFASLRMNLSTFSRSEFAKFVTDEVRHWPAQAKVGLERASAALLTHPLYLRGRCLCGVRESLISQNLDSTRDRLGSSSVRHPFFQDVLATAQVFKELGGDIAHRDDVNVAVNRGERT